MAEAKEVSKKELAAAYAKLQARTKGAQKAAKEQTEEFVRDAITVVSGAGLGYYMGMLEAEAESEDEDAIAESQQIAGIDIDLAVGGVAAIAGLTKMGGKMSESIRAIGVGALTEWAGRTAYDSGLTSKSDEE